uniref:Uncharacterized protein n=1 Tax=Daucus carota subsp. sativus TaxID=79200 RepID=A0A166CLY5_DAUCS
MKSYMGFKKISVISNYILYLNNHILPTYYPCTHVNDNTSTLNLWLEHCPFSTS